MEINLSKDTLNYPPPWLLKPSWTLPSKDLATFVIPKNTIFSATRENVSYEFLTVDSYSSKIYTDSGNNRIFNFTDIELIEGTNFEYNYIVNINHNAQRF